MGENVESIICAMPVFRIVGFICVINSYAGNIRVSFSGDEGYASTDELVKYTQNHIEQ